MYEKTNEFSKAFVNAEFKYIIANVVIMMHRGNIAEAKRFHEKAKEMCKPNYVGKLHSILLKHRYYESLNVTPEAIAFMQQLRL